MNKTDKIIIIFYIVLAVSYVSAILYIDKSFSDVKFPAEKAVKKSLNEITFVRIVDVNKTKIFDTMSNVQAYPLILPSNVLSVRIMNHSGNVIYAEEQVMKSLLKTKLIVKHTLYPYDNQTLEIMSGDAQGTIITERFEGDGLNTTLTTNVRLHLKGVLAPIAFFPESGLKQTLNETMTNFVDYAKGFNNKYKKTVDDLYREILLRPADQAGLEYYGSMLESGKMTVNDVRNSLLASDEAKHALKPSERKTMDELSAGTKKTINDMYRQILQRPADQAGLEYYGSMLESGKMTVDDIRNALLNSQEALDIRLSDPTKRTVDDLYVQIFHKHADEKTLDHYILLLASKNMTLDDVKKDLLNNHK